MYDIVVGYDRNNRMPAYTMAESIMQKASVPVRFTFLHRDMLKMYTRPRGQFDSTEFSNSRFLVPYLFNYQGWTLFTDNDMIVKEDIHELFSLRDDKYAVMCVKHNQICNSNKKFLGYDQVEYNYKNWSSVMLFNNAKCQSLTLDYVNNAPGLDLHQFKWLDSLQLVGDLPLEWNYLVENKNQTEATPKLIHYTDGGPYFEETKNCLFASEWTSVYETINDVKTYK
jgi:lipopolysaccharide biosynthesis glycosyltransferase